ncbi:RidA family protein [Polaromonas sp.]|uniref:RidA family protein n=1 Tax=Polaromonas sp. TaxID=1869339 RepID=UPI003C9307A3
MSIPSSRQAALDSIVHTLGYSFDGDIRSGGNYAPVVQENHVAYVSGQIPRVGDTVVVAGRVGADVTLAQARLAAQVCVVRALLLLAQSLGSLDGIGRMLRITVFVQSAPDFTQQSEVADAASDLLHAVLGQAGQHTRTSVGVYQLPKNAAVEVDLMVSTHAR